MHRVGNAVRKVHDAEEHDERPALQRDVEREVDHDRGRENTDHKPRLELAPFGAGTLDDVAHQRIVQRVEDTRRNHDRRDRAELGRIEVPGQHHERQKIAVDQVIHHIPTDGAEWEEP